MKDLPTRQNRAIGGHRAFVLGLALLGVTLVLRSLLIASPTLADEIGFTPGGPLSPVLTTFPFFAPGLVLSLASFFIAPRERGLERWQQLTAVVSIVIVPLGVLTLMDHGLRPQQNAFFVYCATVPIIPLAVGVPWRRWRRTALSSAALVGLAVAALAAADHRTDTPSLDLSAIVLLQLSHLAAVAALVVAMRRLGWDLTTARG